MLGQFLALRAYSLPAQTSEPDRPRNRFLTVTVVNQHPPGNSQRFCSLVNGQAVLMHPVPDALVADSTCLFDGKIAQIIRAEIKIAFDPFKLSRLPSFMRTKMVVCPE